MEMEQTGERLHHWEQRISSTDIIFRQSAYFHFEQWICDILRKYFYIALPDEYKLPSDPSPDDMVKPVEEYWFGNNFDAKDNPFEEEADDFPFPPDISLLEEHLPF